MLPSLRKQTCSQRFSLEKHSLSTAFMVIHAPHVQQSQTSRVLCRCPMTDLTKTAPLLHVDNALTEFYLLTKLFSTGIRTQLVLLTEFNIFFIFTLYFRYRVQNRIISTPNCSKISQLLNSLPPTAKGSLNKTSQSYHSNNGLFIPKFRLSMVWCRRPNS